MPQAFQVMAAVGGNTFVHSSHQQTKFQRAMKQTGGLWNRNFFPSYGYVTSHHISTVILPSKPCELFPEMSAASSGLI